MTAVRVPSAEGTIEVALNDPADWPAPDRPFTSRIAFAAAHVAADPRGDNVPGAPAAIDWDSTLAFRRHLFRYGFGLAEAMDTAQRNMGLDWAASQQLITASAELAAADGARIASGAGTDHRPEAATLAAVTAAYLEQVGFVQSTGSQVIVMASRQLAATARSAADYAEVYREVIGSLERPAILHWLGPAFDPALAGYWGSDEVAAATRAFVELVGEHQAMIDGVKVSLLSADHEIGLRAALPAGVRLYTGDDFNYPQLIAGDGEHHSDALLGAFAAIAPAASSALAALDRGDTEAFRSTMDDTVALSRHLFEAPTYHYKVGIAFLAWLSGHQPGFTMIGGLHSGRSALHLARVFTLANELRLLPDPDLAAHRVASYLTTVGAV